MQKLTISVLTATLTCGSGVLYGRQQNPPATPRRRTVRMCRTSSPAPIILTCSSKENPRRPTRPSIPPAQRIQPEHAHAK